MNSKETDFAIVVHIGEAIGLNGDCDNVVITASLGRNVLETETVSAQTTSVFDNNLIWETDKSSIKRMKTENLPVKIECYAVTQSPASNDVRALIGFIIVPIRSVPFLGGRRTDKVAPRWHKLIGLSSEWKLKKPEILMRIAITSSANVGDVFTLKDRQETRESTANNMFEPQAGLFVQLVDDDDSPHIQVGDGPHDCHMFIAKINIKSANNLEMLHTSLDTEDSVFHIRYTLFGNAIDNRYLNTKTSDGSYTIQEKIAINFRSSIQSLKEYFQSIFYIPIEIFCNNKIVGNSELNMMLSMPPVTNLNEFIKEYSSVNLTYKMENQNAIVTDALSSRSHHVSEAYFDYEFSIAYIGPVDRKDLVAKSAEDAIQNEITARSSTKESDTSSRIVESNTGRDPMDIKSIPHTYCYRFCLQNVQFNKKPAIGIWQISLHHPKAHTPLALLNVELKILHQNPLIVLENVEVPLYFSATSENIEELIGSEPCILNIKGPNRALATAELDNSILLVQKQNPGVILMENESGEKVAMAHAYVNLDDIGTNFNSQQKKCIRPIMSTNSYLNEDLSYKMLEELEEWKRQQEELFMNELKERSMKHTAELTDEWQQKCEEKERILAQKLEQCNSLTNALEEGHKALKKSIVEEVNRQKEFVETKAELEKMYSTKLASLHERVRRFEEESEHQLEIAAQRLQELETNHSTVQVENKTLKECINELEQTTIPKAQHNDILAELRRSNEELKKSKLFYKEQWAKMVREFNKREIEKAVNSCDEDDKYIK